MHFTIKRKPVASDSVSSTKLPKRKLLLVVAGIVLLALVGLSIAAYQAHKDLVTQQNTALHNQAVAAAVAQKQAVQITQAQLVAVTSDKAVLCKYVTDLSQAKATRAPTTVPVLGHCQGDN